MHNDPVTRKVARFYQERGWQEGRPGVSVDAVQAEDLRPVAHAYVREGRRRVAALLPPRGERLLDAGCGTLQHAEYVAYGRCYTRHVCLDVAQSALDGARAKLGARGEYVLGSVLDMPFADDCFDAAVSLHVIYHIDAGYQESAVRQLLRVVRPGGRVVLVVGNPRRWVGALKRLILRQRSRREQAAAVDVHSATPLYYFAQPLPWWQRFADAAHVRVACFRTLTGRESRRLVPNNVLGHAVFAGLLQAEARWPQPMAQVGAHPMIVLDKY